MSASTYAIASFLGLVVGFMLFNPFESDSPKYTTSVMPLEKYQIRFCIDKQEGQEVCITSGWMPFTEAPVACREAARVELENETWRKE